MLDTLCNTYGPTGDEDLVIDLIKEQLKDHLTEGDQTTQIHIEEDRVGNLIVKKSGSDPQVTISAHMDEAGLFINQIKEDGQLGFESRSIHPVNLVGKQVDIGKDKLKGVIGFTPIHLQFALNNYQNPIKMESLSIDIGCSKKDQASGHVKIGNWAVFSTPFKKEGNIITGKALDNRLCVGALIQILKDPEIPNAITGIFTRIRKTWPWGSAAAAENYSSEYNIVLDTFTAEDGPKTSQYDSDFSPESELGKGPVLAVADQSYISSRKMLEHIEAIVKKENLKCQYKQSGTGFSETFNYSMMSGGHHVMLMGMPCRYQNAPVSMAHQSDYDNLVTLLKRAICTFPKA